MNGISIEKTSDGRLLLELDEANAYWLMFVLQEAKPHDETTAVISDFVREQFHDTFT